jgi:hypothetical protein
MKEPRISSAVFNLGKKKYPPALNREWGGWDNTILRFAKSSEAAPEEYAGALSCRRYQDPLS